jgi:hypothetical protein
MRKFHCGWCADVSALRPPEMFPTVAQLIFFFWRPGPLIIMATPNRNYELHKTVTIIHCVALYPAQPFQIFEHRKSNPSFQVFILLLSTLLPARSHNPPPPSLSFPTFLQRTLPRTLSLLPCCKSPQRLTFHQQTSPLSAVYFCVQSHVEATKTEVREFISVYEPTQPNPHHNHSHTPARL